MILTINLPADELTRFHPHAFDNVIGKETTVKYRAVVIPANILNVVVLDAGMNAEMTLELDLDNPKGA